MIDYNTTLIPRNPARCKEAAALLALVFGEAESALEEEQLFGRETAYNTDVLFSAKDGDTLLGTCHLTIPHAFPQLGAASGLCTSQEARGRGIGRNLFRMMVEEFDARGGETLFLGTSNPIAAGMYAQFGFSFLTGSNVMARSNKKTLIEFYRAYYAPSPVICQRGDASFRIPIIPLVLSRGRDMLMDANTAILSSAMMTQPSCMGLFPRYLELEKKGGAFFGARLVSGAICAMSGILPTEKGNRVDAFAFPGFETELPGMVKLCEDSASDCFAQIAIEDTAKAEMFASLGYKADTLEDYPANFVRIPSRIWRKNRKI